MRIPFELNLTIMLVAGGIFVLVLFECYQPQRMPAFLPHAENTLQPADQIFETAGNLFHSRPQQFPRWHISSLSAMDSSHLPPPRLAQSQQEQ